MRKGFHSLLLWILIFGYSSNRIYSEVESSQKINARIKAGVVMKSGDIKIVARQDFLVLKADLVSIWVKNYQVEKDIKANFGYEQNMAFFQNDINKINKFIANKSTSEAHIIENVASQLKKNLENSYELGKTWGVQEAFERLQFYYVGTYDYLKSCMKDAEKKYLELLSKNITDEYNKAFSDQYEKFKEIIKPMDKIVRDNKDDLGRINIISRERDMFIKEINNKIKDKKEEIVIEFKNKLIENYVLLAKTNLNGEASFAVTKGDYYILLIAQVAEDSIIWNYHFAINNDNQYIELSNDNAYAIRKSGLAYELKTAISSIRKFE